MLKVPAIIVAVLSLSLVMACTPVAEKLSPTPAPATSAPKAAPPPASNATPQPPAPATAAPKAAPPPTSAATPQPAVEKPQRGGTLVYAMPGDATELDPHKTTQSLTRRVSHLLYNNLVNVDEKGDFIPELAESWSTPDPNTWVFKLRKGVKFHDGTDFNAEAVKFNIERIGGPESKSYVQAYVANVQSVEVIDDYTVKFNLKAPKATFLADLASYGTFIVSPTAVKKWGDQLVTHPVGTGPFEFVEWVKDDHLTVKRFDGYWRKDQYGDPLPYLDRVIVKPIPEQSVMLTNLRTGDLDLIGSVLPANLDLVEKDPNLKIVKWGDTSSSMILNNVVPPFNNKALRQAVAWAIDREAIAKSLYPGTGVASRFELASQQWAFDPSGMFYTKNNTKAKEKLAEGGKPNGFKFVAQSYPTPLDQRLAQAMQAQLAEVGIEMEIIPLEAGALSDRRTAGKFEASFSSISGLPLDPDDLVYRKDHTKGGINAEKYSNPEVDKLLEKAQVISDRAERKALYAKAQTLIVDDSPTIYVVHYVEPSAMRQRVMGFVPSININELQFDWFWLKK